MKKNYLFVLLFTLLVSINNIQAENTKIDSTKNILERGLDKIKLQKARHLFIVRDYIAAIEVYDNLYKSNPKDALLNYRLGENYLALKDYQTASNYLEKAVKSMDGIAEEVHVTYAKTLHRLGQFDKSIEQYELYLKSLKSNKTKLIAETNANIEVLKYGKKLMETPVNVKIINMGGDINSVYDDYGPSIAADGKRLIFTSRRPDTRGGGTDEADGKYYEDIYISEWDDTANKWSKSSSILGRLNSEIHDACLSISPNGKKIYVYKNFGENGSGEIYVSKLASSGKWGSPKALGSTINSTYWESSASVTADEKKMYFVSERRNGMGMGDIYEVEKISKREWGEPVNLGSVINTPLDEKMVFIHPDGNVLFFASDGHKGIGGYDIYMSRNIDGKWQAPVNVGYPINTVNDDVNFVLTNDNKTAYYSGYKVNTIGEKDIYKIDVSNYDLIANISGMSVTIKGKIMNAANNKMLSAKMEIVDGVTGATVKEFRVDATGLYSARLPKGKIYTISVKSSGFKKVKETLELKKESKDTEIIKDFKMVK